MNALDPTPQPAYPSPLRSAHPATAPTAKRPHGALPRRKQTEKADQLRISCQSQLFLQRVLREADAGTLRVAHALKHPQLLQALKDYFADSNKVLTISASGTFLQALPTHHFAVGAMLLPNKTLDAQKGDKAYRLVQHDCIFAARLLSDRITNMLERNHTRETGASLATIFQWMLNHDSALRKELLAESPRVPKLVAAAKRVGAAIVFLPKLDGPVAVNRSDADNKRPRLFRRISTPLRGRDGLIEVKAPLLAEA